MSATSWPAAWEFQPEGGDWSPAQVPAPWSRFAPAGTVRGTYRCALQWPAGGSWFLEFEAVATRARVSLDGAELARHTGAWTPFRVPLPVLDAGATAAAHELRVEVDAAPGALTDGFLPVIGAAFAGIWQPVRLLQNPSAEWPPATARVRADGNRLLDCQTNLPISLRGILHWGYYPEHGSPSPTEEQIEAELDHFGSLGFNLIKFCLWAPPRAWLDACERRGFWMWQEYPIWDRKIGGISAEADAAALAEMEELLRRDCVYSRMILRTFTCENDHLGGDLARRLVARARELAPHSLALDNSGWLCSEQAGDFWDEHPYLHPAEWQHYPARMRAALASRPARPLLLGETMSVDTLRPADAAAPPALAGLACAERARRLAIGMRKAEVELLRRELPYTGYAMNVARDIPAAPLGFCDERGRPKFRTEEWSWHRDVMLLAELPRRAFTSGEEIRAPLWVSHFGSQTLRGSLKAAAAGESCEIPLELGAGETRQVGAFRLRAPVTDRPRPFDLNLDSGELHNSWRLWSLPQGATAAAANCEMADRPRADGWRCPTYVWWSPAPWFAPGLLAPEWEELAADLIIHDLLSGRVLEAADGAMPLMEVLDLHSQAGLTIRRPLVLAYRDAAGAPHIVSALRADLPAGSQLHAALAAAAARLDLPRLTVPPPRYDGLLLEDWEMRAPPEAAPRRVRAGDPNHFEGFASFAAEFELPPELAGRDLVLRCEGVGDGYRLWVDDRLVAEAGNMNGTWDGCRDRPQEHALRLTAGRHAIRFLVKDWRAGGGMVGPVWLRPSW
jgi:hypothetical protein